jgi:hypothetical protein
VLRTVSATVTVRVSQPCPVTFDSVAYITSLGSDPSRTTVTTECSNVVPVRRQLEDVAAAGSGARWDDHDGAALRDTDFNRRAVATANEAPRQGRRSLQSGSAILVIIVEATGLSETQAASVRFHTCADELATSLTWVWTCR